MFHLNRRGEAGRCEAKKGQCPFASVDEHYASADEAREAFEAQNVSFAQPLKKNSLASGAIVANSLDQWREDRPVIFTPEENGAVEEEEETSNPSSPIDSPVKLATNLDTTVNVGSNITVDPFDGSVGVNVAGVIFDFD